MNIESLLLRLEHERKFAGMSEIRYGAEALDASLNDDEETATFYGRLRDECCKEIERLDITIEEIKKRVS